MARNEDCIADHVGHERCYVSTSVKRIVNVFSRYCVYASASLTICSKSVDPIAEGTSGSRSILVRKDVGVLPRSLAIAFGRRRPSCQLWKGRKLGSDEAERNMGGILGWSNWRFRDAALVTKSLWFSLLSTRPQMMVTKRFVIVCECQRAKKRIEEPHRAKVERTYLSLPIFGLGPRIEIGPSLDAAGTSAWHRRSVKTIKTKLIK